MIRRLVNDGGKVFGWTISHKGIVELHTYTGGYIGYMREGKVYDLQNRLVKNVRINNIEQYIIEKNNSTTR